MNDICEILSTAPPVCAEGLVCRFCNARLSRTFIDLGLSPLCESFVPAARASDGEIFYPLHVRVCDECHLVQLEEFVSPQEIFSDYAYFSSYSDSWVEHARRFAVMAAGRFDLDASSKVIEIASNDGYLLQHFVAMGIPVLGVEPAANVAEAAVKRGIPTLMRFLTPETAAEVVESGNLANLVVANNVLAHVPDINGFVTGIAMLLAPDGVVSFEFPHLLRLIERNQFDTIYHEHFSYLSLRTTRRILEEFGLEVFDVTELASHGGSIRVFAQHRDTGVHEVSDNVAAILKMEGDTAIDDPSTHISFQARVRDTKWKLLEFLIGARRDGKQVAGYGAPGKGNTLLNYCGIRTDLIEYTVDRNPLKQGMLLPGSRIPIFAPDRIAQTKPDLLVLLPWNLSKEIVAQMNYTRNWGCQFVVPIPEVSVIK